MSRLQGFVATLFLLSIVLFAPAVGLSQETHGTRPNVLFILTDDQRWDCVGLEPRGVVATPNIDRLGREGVWFRNHFCTTSLCSPSRGSILTGLYAHAHGVTNNFTEYPESVMTWPKALQQLGYDTAYIGKYHMGEENDEPRPGFDYFATHRGQGKYFDTEFRINGGERAIIPGYYTTVVTDLAETWIRERETDQPWAMILGHKAPHSFYTPEPKYEHAFDHVNAQYPASAFQIQDNDSWYKQRLSTWHGIYGPLFDFRKEWPNTSPEAVSDFARMQRSYWSTILSVDDSVGRLLRVLEERGELDNTIVIFTADNGLLAGEHGMIDKRTAHEPSIRIPLLMRYPGVVPVDQSRQIQQMTLTVDFAPSILELCGAEPLEAIHGKSWVETIRDPESARGRDAFVYMYNYEKQFPYTPNVRAIRTDRWKLVRYPHGDGSPDRHTADLFDLHTDPDETTNLINDPAHKSLVVELDRRMSELISELGAAPDQMPLDEGIGTELPDASIR